MGQKLNRRRINSEGYIVIGGGKNARYEHREVIEKKIGRKLLPNEVVHHINGIRTDNREENLQIMTLAQHSHHHHHQPEVKTTCKQCGKPLKVKSTRLRNSKSGNVFCNQVCSGLYFKPNGPIGRPISPDDKKKIRDLFTSGHNYNQISKQVNRNHVTVHDVLRREGLVS